MLRRCASNHRVEFSRIHRAGPSLAAPFPGRISLYLAAQRPVPGDTSIRSRSRRRMKRSRNPVFSQYPRNRFARVSIGGAARINHYQCWARYGCPKNPSSSLATSWMRSARREGLGARWADPGIGSGRRAEPMTWLSTRCSAMTASCGSPPVGRFSRQPGTTVGRRGDVIREPRVTTTVIVGHGPLRGKELQRLIDGSGLSRVAFVVGPFTNPFPVLAAADCFVLSSSYEGQPMRCFSKRHWHSFRSCPVKIRLPAP
jgi:hypothetical protein